MIRSVNFQRKVWYTLKGRKASMKKNCLVWLYAYITFVSGIMCAHASVIVCVHVMCMWTYLSCRRMIFTSEYRHISREMYLFWIRTLQRYPQNVSHTTVLAMLQWFLNSRSRLAWPSELPWNRTICMKYRPLVGHCEFRNNLLRERSVSHQHADIFITWTSANRCQNCLKLTVKLKATKYSDCHYQYSVLFSRNRSTTAVDVKKANI